MVDDTTNTPDTDDTPTDGGTEADDDPSRRRLIRWIAVLAFAVPVVVELLTFGNLLGSELLPGGEEDGEATGGESSATSATPAESAVGVDDELLPGTAPTETVSVSEIRGEPGARTYVLRVTVENTTDDPVELRLTSVTLRDGTELDSVSSTGTVAAGERGEVTGAWELPTDSMPVAVSVVLRRGDSVVAEESVPLERPPIRG